AEEELDRGRQLLEERVAARHDGAAVELGPDDDFLVARANAGRGAEQQLGTDGAAGERVFERAVLHAESRRVDERTDFPGAHQPRYEPHLAVTRVVVPAS